MDRENGILHFMVEFERLGTFMPLRCGARVPKRESFCPSSQQWSVTMMRYRSGLLALGTGGHGV